VVGQPEVGKSSFLAFLIGRAERTLLLPGFEEDLERVTLPRLKAHGAKLSTVNVLNDRPYHFPGHTDLLTAAAQRWRADLIVLDPVDSYTDEGKGENDSVAVRLALEALATLAIRTGAAVVGTRHPGKDPTNVCPGSRQWRAVPRVILELVSLSTDPPQQHISSYKCSIRKKPPPLSFTLADQGKRWPVFTPGELVDPAEAALAHDLPKGGERWKHEEAWELIQAVLADGEKDSREVIAKGEEYRINESTLRHAAARYGVTKRGEGYGAAFRCYWTLPDGAGGGK
jgi:hypothetical protein